MTDQDRLVELIEAITKGQTFIREILQRMDLEFIRGWIPVRRVKDLVADICGEGISREKVRIKNWGYFHGEKKKSWAWVGSKEVNSPCDDW